jgi:uncharacterized protein YdeI (YjbR/CyaY-like superfamily)
MNPKVDAFLKRAEKWQDEMKQLRAIALGCGLAEKLKWGKPCYTLNETNVVLIVPFKETCALLFAKGVLLKDPHGLLTKASENMQATRWIKFSHVREIAAKKSILKAYIQEAIAAEKAGLKVKYKKTSDFPVPEEFQQKLDKIPALKKAFAALTPGRQRGYLLYFAAAKQSATRAARVEKHRQRILNGKGLNDE